MKKFMLSIPTPCHENWEQMTPQERGRFCAACQKTVVDFTNMSDRQVVEYFKKANNVCGRFNTTQLEREIPVPRKSFPWARTFFQLTLPTFLLSLKTSAQGEVRVKTVVCATPTKKEAGVLSKPDSIAGSRLKGKVVAEEGRPVVGATVNILGTTINTQTDDNGYFHFQDVKDNQATIAVFAVGYGNKIVTLTSNDTSVVPIVTLSPQVAGRVIATVGFVNVKKKKLPIVPLLQGPKSEPAFSKFSVFPNPATSHSNITLEATKLKEGSYQMAIVNSLGVVVQADEIVFDKSVKRIAIELKELAAGQYFIQLTNRKSGKVYAETILIN